MAEPFIAPEPNDRLSGPAFPRPLQPVVRRHSIEP